MKVLSVSVMYLMPPKAAASWATRAESWASSSASAPFFSLNCPRNAQPTGRDSRFARVREREATRGMHFDQWRDFAPAAFAGRLRRAMGCLRPARPARSVRGGARPPDERAREGAPWVPRRWSGGPTPPRPPGIRDYAKGLRLATAEPLRRRRAKCTPPRLPQTHAFSAPASTCPLHPHFTILRR